MYIRGPYSSDLADDCYEVGIDVGKTTCVSDEAIRRLASIFENGLGYVDACATVLLIKECNCHASVYGIRGRLSI